MGRRYRNDVLVIGSGAAGLAAGVHLAPHASVAVLSKGNLDAGSTNWAQGGIAAVTDPADSEYEHVQDTLRAGAGLCRERTVWHVVCHARECIEQLIRWGVAFDRENGGFHLTQEGGHSFRRVLHVADATGNAISTNVLREAKQRPSIELFQRHVAIDLVTTHKLAQLSRGHRPIDHQNRCIGAYVYNEQDGRVDVFTAPYVILATGGASKVYLYTTNPDGNSGDGIAMAWRAGCRIANMEFNQFHPTCLYHPEVKSFLITEAIRGEGGLLRLPNGERFMDRFHEQGELAPRDIVARAIDHEMKRLGIDCVYLDISHKPADFIKAHFPTVYERCLDFGIDITCEPIPVVPAAHYTCGGVVVDQHGRTDVPNLYGIGETTFTGLHGANRLASNSLLECFVYARSAAADILAQLPQTPTPASLPSWDASQVTDSDEDVIIAHNWD